MGKAMVEREGEEVMETKWYATVPGIGGKSGSEVMSISNSHLRVLPSCV